MLTCALIAESFFVAPETQRLLEEEDVRPTEAQDDADEEDHEGLCLSEEHRRCKAAD